MAVHGTGRLVVADPGGRVAQSLEVGAGPHDLAVVAE